MFVYIDLAEGIWNITSGNNSTLRGKMTSFCIFFSLLPFSSLISLFREFETLNRGLIGPPISKIILLHLIIISSYLFLNYPNIIGTYQK